MRAVLIKWERYFVYTIVKHIVYYILEVFLFVLKNRMSYVQLNRSKEVEELMKEKNCFMLLAQIAYRARRTDSFNVNNLDVWESLIWDHLSIWLSSREYRTAKDKLKKWWFATFKTTSKWTIAKIVSNCVFDINEEWEGQTERQASDKLETSKRQAKDKQETTNKNVNKDNKEKNDNKKENFKIKISEEEARKIIMDHFLKDNNDGDKIESFVKANQWKLKCIKNMIMYWLIWTTSKDIEEYESKMIEKSETYWLSKMWSWKCNWDESLIATTKMIDWLLAKNKKPASRSSQINTFITNNKKQ